MKNLIITCVIAFLGNTIYAQNNSVGIGTLTPDNSAILELNSSTQGFLMTRLTTSDINTMPLPAEGIITYNVDDKCFWFQDNSNWKRICNTDSLLVLINTYGDTIGYIYDSLAVHNNLIYNNISNITNNTTNIQNLSDSLGWVYDSLAVHNTNIYNNTIFINALGDTIGYIYDSLAVHNNLIYNNISNITNNTTNIQNLSDSLGWVYDSLQIHNTNIFNLFDSISVINNHLGVIDSTLLEKWDLNGNSGTSALTNFLGTIDGKDLVFRTSNIERARITASGSLLMSGSGGSVPITGAGIRLQYTTSRMAFRAGQVTGTHWDLASTGTRSFAFGYNPIASGDYSFSFGNSTTASGSYSFAYGYSSIASGNYSFALGKNVSATQPNAFAFGQGCVANGWYSFAGGHNSSTSSSSAFAMGEACQANGSGSVALGTGNTATMNQCYAIGVNNTATISGAMALSGYSNATNGNAVAILNANATHNSSMVLGQGTSEATWGFVSEFSGGYKMYSNATSTLGVSLAPGSGAWASVSDQNKKTNIKELNYSSLLEKYKEFEINEWSYITQTVDGQDKYLEVYNEKGELVKIKPTNMYEKDIYHIGVMAQDFFKSFGLGTSEETVTTLDISGVNMAAIKGLLEKIDLLEKRIKQLEDENK